MRTGDMFAELKPPRKAPEKLMHVCDAGGGCEEDGSGVMVRLRCSRCGHETKWLCLATVTEAKRGKPCPVCNASERTGAEMVTSNGELSGPPRAKPLETKKVNEATEPKETASSGGSRLKRFVGPLFVPLRSEYYDAFSDGSKREELRLYGPRWNERTCAVGREVVLSKGYGKKHRMTGRIWKFKRQHGTTFGSTYRAAILACYGTLDVWIACFAVGDLRPNAPAQAAAKAAHDAGKN